MIIPEGTFGEVEGPKFSLPFRYLRTWFFSLLALIALPLGAMLFLVGAEIDQAASQWTETTASVVQVNEDGIRYESAALDSNTATFSFVWDDFVDVPISGIALNLSVCDLVSRFIVPQEEGAAFPIWYNPKDSSQRSCVPITEEAGIVYSMVGTILLLFSAWRLLRMIHAAGLQSKTA
jgi:hypothetical protein